MKRFRNCIINKDIPFAIDVAENLLKENSEMIKEVSNKLDFLYNSGSGFQVSNNLLSDREPVNIFSYRPWKKSKAIGYYQNGSIYVSVYFLENLNFPALIGFLLHEYAHHCGYNHYSSFGTSNYKTNHKVNHSVPYFLSENVGKWL